MQIVADPIIPAVEPEPGSREAMVFAAFEGQTSAINHQDWDAWITYGTSLGYGRIGLWGHSLGAVKTIYYLAATRDDRVVAAVDSSPPRQSYETYLAQPPEERAMYVRDYEAAKQAVDEGDSERLITTEYRRRTVFTARTSPTSMGRTHATTCSHSSPR